MSVTGLLFLLIAHYFTGRGIIKLFKLNMSELELSSISFIVGVTVHSLVPSIMELMHVKLTSGNIYTWLSVCTMLCSIPLIMDIKNTKINKPSLPQLYELPFLLVIGFLAVHSVWRCFYFPPTPRDVLTGVELIADRTVIEHTMINSAFSVDVRLNGAANNIFKSPFITSLQIIYKILVLPFGQMWLSVLFLSFTTWMYSLIRSKVHPLIAATLMLVYMAVPDLFAYTYIILWDYSNMIFFTIGYVALMKHLTTGSRNELIWASFMLGMATYIRSETLVLTAMLLPIAAYYQFRSKDSLKDIAIKSAILMAGPVIMNVVLSKVLIANLIPYKFELGSLINEDPLNIGHLMDKVTEIASLMIFSTKGEAVFAKFFYIFLIVLVADMIFTRKLSKEGALALWGVAVVYLGLALLSHLIPSHTIQNSAKRGLFKLLPLAILYMANSGLLQKLSEFLKARELKATTPKTVLSANINNQKDSKGKK